MGEGGRKISILECLLILMVALVIGIGSVLRLVNNPPMDRGIRSGTWRTNPSVGSAQANMYVRAVVARMGLFALAKKEAVYYRAYTDGNGDLLRPDCNYIIEGTDMDTRWWNITLYGQDHFLIPNAWERYSYNMNNVHRDINGIYRIRLSSMPQEGDWLPTGGGENMSLMLRLYSPEPVVYENLGTIQLPRVIKERCP